MEHTLEESSIGLEIAEYLDSEGPSEYTDILEGIESGSRPEVNRELSRLESSGVLSSEKHGFLTEYGLTEEGQEIYSEARKEALMAEEELEEGILTVRSAETREKILEILGAEEAPEGGYSPSEFQSEVRQETGVSGGAFYMSLGKLREEELVERKSLEGKRATLYELTEKGESVYDELFG